jgi:hypothetical protein
MIVESVTSREQKADLDYGSTEYLKTTNGKIAWPVGRQGRP